jgi:hypothetical protein
MNDASKGAASYTFTIDYGPPERSGASEQAGAAVFTSFGAWTWRRSQAELPSAAASRTEMHDDDARL